VISTSNAPHSKCHEDWKEVKHCGCSGGNIWETWETFANMLWRTLPKQVKLDDKQK
jgi:hypothetical protein